MTNSNSRLAQKQAPKFRAPTVSIEARRAHDEIEFYNECSDDLKNLYEPSDEHTRPEHASHLNSISQEARDMYERGATVYGNTLIIPRENARRPDHDSTIRLGTHAHAVREFAPLVGEEAAKNAAAEFVELGRAIAGRTADSNTRIVVLQTFYREITRDDKGKILSPDEQAARLAPTLERMREFARAMQAEEWTRERGEFVSIEDWERGNEDRQRDSEHETHGRLTYRIAEIHGLETEHGEIEEGRERIADEREASFKLPEIAYERVSLNDAPPRFPDSLSAEDEQRLLQEIIPRLDRQIETGARPRDILSALRREQHAAELAARTEQIANIFGREDSTSPPEKAVTRSDELRALYILHKLIPNDPRFSETRESTARLIAERAPSPGDMFETITEVGARLASEYRQQTARLSAYEAAENEGARLAANALQFREIARASDEFQLARQRLAADEHVRGVQANAALSFTHTRQVETPSQVSNYPDLTGEKPLVSEYTRLRASHQIESTRARTLLADQLVDPITERAQVLNAAEIEKHRTHFSRLLGREIENAEDARSGLTPHHERTRALLHRLHAERSQLNIPTTERHTPEKHPSSHVLVAFSGNNAEKLPLANFGEYQVFARYARQAKLPTRVFESLNGREITGESNARQEFYGFAREYVAYRMKDETTRLFNGHRLFREFAARLDTAKAVDELHRTINDIRRENYDRAKHPERFAEERREFTAREEQTRRPLGHSEIRAVLSRAAPPHYTDEMRELRLSRSEMIDSRNARIRHLEQSESSRSPELQLLLREFSRARHDVPARFMRNVNAFLSDYLNPPDARRDRFSPENLYETGKRLQPVERDFLFKFINETKTALTNGVPVKDINRAAFDGRDNESQQLNTSKQPKAQANERVASESPSLQQILGASLWREAELLAASQHHSSAALQSAKQISRSSFSERELESIAILLTQHRGQPKHLAAVARYLNASGDLHQRRLGEVLTTFHGMRAAQAGEGELRFEITAARESLIERDDWTKLLDYFSLRLNDGRSLKLPDAQRHAIKREALASAWREVEPQELRQPERLLDASPEALAHAIAAHREIQHGRALQERTRTATDLLTAHFKSIVNQTSKELAKTDPAFADETLEVERTVRLALTSDSTHNEPGNSLDGHDQAQRERTMLVTRAISPRDREQYRMLTDFADRAKNEYIENFFRIDERLAALTHSTRESRNLERTASQTRAAFDARENVALGRELKQLIESGEAEKLISAERVGRADSVRDLLPEDVRERAREAASHHNEREAHELSLVDLRETLEERVSGYLTSAVREGGMETLRTDPTAARHAQQVSRIIIESIGEHGRNLSASSDDLRFIEMTATKLVDEINTAFYERTRAASNQEREHQPGEIARRDYQSPHFTMNHDGSDVLARKPLQEESTERLPAYNHDEVITQSIGSNGEHAHEPSITRASQPAKLNTERSPHKPTAPEIAADARDQHFRHYVLTR